MLTALLEVIAGERPDALPATIETLQNSVAWSALEQLAKGWGIKAPGDRAGAEKVGEGLAEAAAELITTLQVACANLNGLERRRGRWSVNARGFASGGGIRGVSIPNVCAVLDLAAVRAGRVSTSRADKLRRSTQKLKGAAGRERARRMVRDLLSGPRPEDNPP